LTFPRWAFTLRPDSYDWEFVTAKGEPFEDRGTGQCVH
jgi:hypothetical protein